MQSYKLFSPDEAALPLPPAHAHKSPETLRMEFKLYSAAESLIALELGSFKAVIRPQLEPFHDEFPYWSVVTEKDIGPLVPRGFRAGILVYPFEPTFSSSCEPALHRKRWLESKYAVKSDAVLSHMMIAVEDIAAPHCPYSSGILQAVNMVIRLTDTLAITAGRLRRRALALAARMGVEEQVLAAEDLRNGLLLSSDDDSKPRPWVGTHPLLHNVPAYERFPEEQKPGNRVAFEERVTMVFDGLIRSEPYDYYVRDTVRISSRVTQVDYRDMTAEQRQRTGTMHSYSVCDALIRGDTVEGIQLSLQMAAGLRVVIGRLDEAVDLYLAPVTLAIAMSQHGRLGERSPLHRLDVHTLRAIAVFCKQGWVDFDCRAAY